MINHRNVLRKYLPELFKSIPPKVRFSSPLLWGKVFYNVNNKHLSRKRELSHNMDHDWKTKYCASIPQNLNYGTRISKFMQLKNSSTGHNPIFELFR
jgi:hypothetical protein